MRGMSSGIRSKSESKLECSEELRSKRMSNISKTKFVSQQTKLSLMFSEKIKSTRITNHTHKNLLVFV